MADGKCSTITFTGLKIHCGYSILQYITNNNWNNFQYITTFSTVTNNITESTISGKEQEPFHRILMAYYR